MNAPRRLILSCTALLVACGGRGIEYEGGVPQDTGPVEQTECGDESLYGDGFRIEGLASDFVTGDPVAGGLCVYAVDPLPAVTGGDPEILASSVTCDDGRFVVAGIAEVPAIGAFVSFDDCEGEDDLTMQTATGISVDDLTGLGDGDAFTGVNAIVITQDTAAIFNDDMAGYSGDVSTGGLFAGFLVDSSGAGVSGGTVSCSGCEDSVYYGDGDPSDGYFGSGSTMNTSTSAAAGGFFMVPEGPITSYSAEDGGAHTWDDQTLGSLPGWAVLVTRSAQ